MAEPFVALEGPHGLVYVRPGYVSAMSYIDALNGVNGPVRLVTVVGGASYYIFDTTDNLTKLFSNLPDAV